MDINTAHAQRVLRDAVLDQQLRDRGFIVADFLTPAEIGALTAVYYQGEKTQREQFTTFATDDYGYKKKVDQEIKATFASRFAEMFEGYLPFWGNFFLKQPSAPAMPLHADLQYVDEPEQRSFNIWCPLVDTDEHNGTLGLVPYSHSLISQIRGTNITDGYRLHAAEIRQSHGELIALKAGQAIIYDHRLLHYSPANMSGATRLAATLSVVPEAAPLYHYYAEQEGDTTIYKYAISSIDELLQMRFLQRPAHLEPTETIHGYCFSPLTVDDIKNQATGKR